MDVNIVHRMLRMFLNLTTTMLFQEKWSANEQFQAFLTFSPHNNTSSCASDLLKMYEE